MELMNYKNYKDKEINTDDLKDKELVNTYRFFLKYCNAVKKIITEDEIYKEYNKDMINIKDGLKAEIMRRKLKMSQF